VAISAKVDLKPKLVKEGHFVLIKRAIHQEGITIADLYAPDVGVPNFIKHRQTLTQRWGRLQYSTITNR
jgi:hypothetical protein